MPRNASEIPRKFCEYHGGIFLAYDVSGDGIGEEFQDPSDDNAVSDRNAKGADHRDQPDERAEPGMFHCKCFFKRTKRSGMHGAPECHFTDNACESDEDYKQDVRDEKSGSAELAGAVWEEPDVCHSHRAADAGDDKSPLAVKLIF